MIGLTVFALGARAPPGRAALAIGPALGAVVAVARSAVGFAPGTPVPVAGLALGRLGSRNRGYRTTDASDGAHGIGPGPQGGGIGFDHGLRQAHVTLHAVGVFELMRLHQ